MFQNCIVVIISKGDLKNYISLLYMFSHASSILKGVNGESGRGATVSHGPTTGNS